jgi:hypothetical protein
MPDAAIGLALPHKVDAQSLPPTAQLRRNLGVAKRRVAVGLLRRQAEGKSCTYFAQASLLGRAKQRGRPAGRFVILEPDSREL